MLLHDLQPASFRGAPFLVPSDDTEEGRNAIEHLYPDGSRRYAEDNGYIPPCFEIKAILHGAGLKGKLARVRSALNRQGPGVLKHPHYGTQFVQVDGTYRVTRDDNHAGVIELSVKFLVTGPPSLPGLVSGIAATVTGLSTGAVTKLFDAFVAEYGVPTSNTSATVVSDALTRVATVLADQFGSASDVAGIIISKADGLVRRPSELRTLLVQAFRAPFDDQSISNTRLVVGYCAVLREAAAQGGVIAAIVPTTRDLERRKQSALSLIEAIHAAAFACQCDAVAGQVYETSDGVDRDERGILDNFETVQALELSGEIHADLLTLYTQTSDVLRTISVRLPFVTTISITPVPASVLAYQLYESDTDLQALVRLNLSQDPALMSQAANVLMRDAI